MGRNPGGPGLLLRNLPGLGEKGEASTGTLLLITAVWGVLFLGTWSDSDFRVGHLRSGGVRRSAWIQDSNGCIRDRTAGPTECKARQTRRLRHGHCHDRPDCN